MVTKLLFEIHQTLLTNIFGVKFWKKKKMAELGFFVVELIFVIILIFFLFSFLFFFIAVDLRILFQWFLRIEISINSILLGFLGWMRIRKLTNKRIKKMKVPTSISLIFILFLYLIDYWIMDNSYSFFFNLKNIHCRTWTWKGFFLIAIIFKFVFSFFVFFFFEKTNLID